jgi:hypothetical protein
MAAACQELRPEHLVQASRGTRIVRQAGGAFGTAVAAIIMQRQTAGHAAAGTPGRARAFGHTFWWTLIFTASAVIPRALPAQGAPVGFCRWGICSSGRPAAAHASTWKCPAAHRKGKSTQTTSGGPPTRPSRSRGSPPASY